ncbi:MAG: hypothetical protein RLY67_1087 [Pseudomonadota bacterium]
MRQTSRFSKVAPLGPSQARERHRPAQPILSIAAAIGLSFALLGCAKVSQVRENPPSWLTPYRSDIGQGNFITKSQADRLKRGMRKEEVRLLLGTPLLVDPFRENRWDYVFDIRKGDGSRERRRFFVEFKGDALEQWGGDELPTESGDALLPMRPAR